MATGRRPIDIAIDLSEAQRAADVIKSMLLDLRRRPDLSSFEYAPMIRISPGEVPHSHPVLTLNTMLRNEDALLSTFLHEQMHWYTTWFASQCKQNWTSIWSELRSRYPEVPVKFPEGAHTEDSSYLHLIVNWLEVDACGSLLGVDRAREIAAKNFVYSGIYRMVLRDWNELAQLYKLHGLYPRRGATDMTANDLAIAGQSEKPNPWSDCDVLQ